ncbi:hypothetical protein GJV26_00105 [Massilia dura]|uniref:Uncharacterized protein n=1 Tax=Pseudoduganella dura TaxID=321982 RepID=A0A6I3X258_9BURK|nr:hypothetical protein [Pseudoduganella dura]MUI10899.1 hypothetical protein [Pseudoduganella dura]GGY12631.1 hypothetical protein GCM10007386_48610 [Pseudoduganella dura]
MANTKFQRLSYSAVYQQVDPVTATLVAGAAAAVVATFDITPIKFITVSLDVTIAALTGVEVWVRGDTRARWIQLTADQLDGYGRSDTGTDINSTPAGSACFMMLNCIGWSDVMIKAKSAGAAKLSVTAGGQ